jgi:subfamily B ATP-binding cassette protein MsbA
MINLVERLRSVSGVNAQLQRGLAAAESIFQLLDREEEPDDGSVALGRARGELRFDRVSLHYGANERAALADVTLTIPPGQTVALVGPSGSGKTSLVNLIPRFYPVSEGRILLDKLPIETLRLASLRAQIAWVSQQVMLFNDTIAANIAYGAKRDAAPAAIAAAARGAYLEDFIASLPDGMQTMIGDNGVRLSGGQRQRLSIARAILKDAPILILDEATSALDNESERFVQAALEALMRGRTTLVIAHRLSTVIRANRIVVLSHGRIGEQGTHTQLLEANGVYARLYAGDELG